MDAKQFWGALGSRAIGYAVVTAADIDGPAGFLALSATHLSADPPMMMVSIGPRTSALTAIANSRHFAINFLARGSDHLVESFGGMNALKGADRFEKEDWTTLRTGAPILKSGVGSLDCVLEETIERYGSTIVIGRLVDHIRAEGGEPMISYGGKVYRS